MGGPISQGWKMPGQSFIPNLTNIPVFGLSTVRVALSSWLISVLRSVIQQNPNMLSTMLQQIGQSNPQLLQIISQVRNCTHLYTVHTCSTFVHICTSKQHVYLIHFFVRTKRRSSV